MEIVFYSFTVIATFFFMEFMAWFTHKYVMHGFMWYFHKDHHQHEIGFFEKNDVFFLIFAIPSWLCIMLGLMNAKYYVVCIGIGIAIYGLFYFLMHDIFIHQRFKWFRNSKNPYLLALRKAHKTHHKHLGKEHGEVFGMLIVPSRFYKESQLISAKKRQNK
jgi:beta-carotene 3-hydroxylase